MNYERRIENHETQQTFSTQAPTALIRKQLMEKIYCLGYPSAFKSSVRTLILLCLGFIQPILLGFWLFLMGSTSLSSQEDFSGNIYDFQWIFQTISIILTIFNFVGLAIILGLIKLSKNSQKVNVRTNMLMIMQVSVDLNFHIAAFLLSLSAWQNGALFMLAAAQSLFSCIFMENYSQRKDIFYCSSAEAKIIFKSIQVASYTFSVAFFLIKEKTLYCSSTVILSASLLAWYLKSGYRIYTNILSKTILEISLAFQITVCYDAIAVLMSSNQIVSFQITEQLLSLSLVMLFLRLVSINNLRFITEKPNKKKQNLKELNLLIDCYQQMIDNDKHAQILGIMKTHESSKCNNIFCFLKQEVLYDPLLEVYHKDKTSIKPNQLVSLYLKCRYQQKRQQKGEEWAARRLQYCEFLMNQCPNTVKSAQICRQLQIKDLNLFQRIQLCKIKQAIRQKSDYFNNILYQGRLQIEKIIQAEDCMKTIQSNIKRYVFDNIEIWNGFKDTQISLSSFRKQISEGFDLIQLVDSLWLKLIEHFPNQRRWRYMYLNYLLFLKNKKLKSKDIQEFGLTPQEDEIFRTVKIFKEAHQKKAYIDTNLLFDPQTCCIHVKEESKQLIVKRISQYFPKIFNYEAQQIVGSTMDRLLPLDIRERHSEAVVNWINLGFCNDPNSYIIRLTGCLNKYQQQLPVIKYYKQHYNLESSCVQFICMLKLNQKQSITEINIKQNAKDNQFSVQQKNIAQFIAKSGQKKLKLSQKTNIFIKQECYIPQSSIRQITQIQYLMRSYSLIIICTVGVLTLVNNADSSKLVSYATQYITFMELYRIPMMLGNNYYKSLLGVGNYTKTTNEVAQLTSKMQSYISNPIILKTLFDQSINSPAEYHPIQITGQGLNQSVNQIQLFFTVASCMTSMGILPITEEDINFKMFRSYLKPGYDEFLNNTKNNFHSSFQSIFGSINTKQIIMLGAQSFILLIFSVISFLKVYMFFQRMKNIIQAILNFHPIDREVIYRYWCHTFIIFENLIFRNQCMKTALRELKIRRKSEFSMKKISEIRKKSTENMFTTSNSNIKLIASKETRKFQTKMFLLLSVSLLFAYSLVTFCELSSFNNYKSLVEFQKDGFAFLQYFPTATIVSYGILQKYYLESRGQPELFNKTNYEDAISNMELVGEFSYISTIKDNRSSYYIKQRNYFFGNPCISNPAVIEKIGISLQKCLLLTNASLTRGLTAYMRQAIDIARPYLQGTRSISKSELEQFSLSVGVLSAYILDAITTWGIQFNERVNSITTSVTNLNIIQMLSVLVCHLLIFQLIILQHLNKQYNFFRRIFQQMVPQYLLVKEKLIRQRFIELQIIPKS